MESVEFFCGLGGFAVVAAERGIPVTAAFDQDADACSVYEANFGRAPVRCTLGSLDLTALPGTGALWWLSPPCTPFTRRGARRDAADPRAAAFLRLIEEVARRGDGAGPRLVVVENVAGFCGSEVHRRLREAWTAAGYALGEIQLCPTQFGIPMKRPRVFVAAVAGGPPPRLVPPPLRAGGFIPLAGFLDEAAMRDPALRVPEPDVARYGASLNIVDPSNPAACAICFTSGYGKSWKAAGSFLRCPDGALRRFAPGEILRLLGFPPDFRFPQSLSLPRRWHLAGNSLSLDCVRDLLGQVGV